MHGDVKRIRFHLMGLAIVIITLLQLLLIALNRVAIIENEWKRLENYAWNVKIKASTITSRAVRRSFRSIRTRLT